VTEAVHAPSALEWDTPLYEQATTQFEHALALAEVPDFVASRLRYPERALIVSLPVRLDDGTVTSFPAYRVQHSSVLGQGFGNVGGVAATELRDRGARVIAVSDMSGGVYREGGLDVPALQAHVAEHVTNEELLELPCDVLVLAAREDQVTAANAPNLQCRLLVEGANGPTSVEADAILAERDILVLPDVLTNAGGVTVSYFEWVQDLGRLFWDRDEIRRRLADKLSDAFDRVWTVAHERGISLRDAALVAAIREVSAALEARGIYP